MAKDKFGKYRAIVIDTDDPEKRGRIRVKCPSVLHESLSGWCEACLPNVSSSGSDFSLPKTGDQVWIEFEQGNINKPIYVGSWFVKGQVDSFYPPASRSINYNGHTITFSEGMVTIETPDGTDMVLKSGGLYVNDVKVAMVTDLPHSH